MTRLNESILQYWNRAKQTWNNFSKNQKILFLSTIILMAVSIPLIVYNLSKTEYAVAFNELQPNDAAAITDYLNDSKIPYVLSTDGASISVPRSQVASVKIGVASQGLNKNGAMGYESLKESSFGTTDNEFSIKKLSMVQGELQQLLNSFDSISSSKVMITLPEKTAFASPGKTEQATAAVVLQVKNGYTLEASTIDAMYRLVSNGVKNLPVENITITEQNGQLLPYSKANGVADSASTVAMQFQIRKQFEQDIRNNVTQLLSKIIGPGKVVPMVTASFNFDKRTEHQALVTPVNEVDTKGIEISVQQIQKSYTSDNGAVGGVAGTGETEVPTYPGGSSTGKSSSEENQSTINYEVNRITRDIESSPYVINDLTISVGVEPPDVNNPESLSANTRTEIEKLLVNVISASLANSGRTFTAEELAGKVTVFAQPFGDTAVAGSANSTNWLLIGGVGAAAVALAAAGGYLVSRRRRKRQEEEELAVPARIEQPTIDLETVTNDNQVRKQLETLAKKKPEEFVGLLRTWLVDE